MMRRKEGGRKKNEKEEEGGVLVPSTCVKELFPAHAHGRDHRVARLLPFSSRVVCVRRVTFRPWRQHRHCQRPPAETTIRSE